MFKKERRISECVENWEQVVRLLNKLAPETPDLGERCYSKARRQVLICIPGIEMDKLVNFWASEGRSETVVYETYCKATTQWCQRQGHSQGVVNALARGNCFYSTA
jgi:hypothetical protein